MKKSSLICVVSLLTTVECCLGASIVGLGWLGPGVNYSGAFGVSADGGVVVGVSRDEAFRWTSASGMVGLGTPPVQWPVTWQNSHAHGISGDGKVIVGMGQGSQANAEAFRWTAPGGWQALGSDVIGSSAAPAYAASFDGSVIVGTSGGAAFRWTTASGIQSIGNGSANAVTPDGNVIVGGSGSSGAFRWTLAGGTTFLGDLDGGAFWSHAYGVSQDGQAVCGYGISAFGNEAFRWTPAGGMVGLGDLPGGNFNSFALGISGDGNTVVGTSDTGLGPEAFIWDATHGMQRLQTVLELDYGLDLSRWQTLERARAISTDGSTIVGDGINSSGQAEAWVVVIPEPSPTALCACFAAIFFGLTRARQLAVGLPLKTADKQP
jgi:probable HAF family extracellular repeat protein